MFFRLIFTVPLLLLLIMFGYFLVSLGRNADELPSPLIGEIVPSFQVVSILPDNKLYDNNILKGQISVLNVFASWCVPCVAEHPYISAMRKQTGIRLVGLSWNDEKEDSLKFLKKHGNPYDFVVTDREYSNNTAIDWGVYGVPESYIIDASGVVRHKHVGPILKHDLENKIIPLIKQLQNEGEGG